jgi:hypothetical protein
VLVDELLDGRVGWMDVLVDGLLDGWVGWKSR